MITNRELRYFLHNKFPDSCIDFLKFKGYDDLIDEGMEFFDYVDMMEQIMLKYRIRIPRQDWKDLCSLSHILYYLNHHEKEPDVDETFIERIRDMYRRN